jgi:hypothetical protein
MQLMSNIPNELLQALAREAKTRYLQETGYAGKVTVQLGLPDQPAPTFIVTAFVVGVAGERRFEIEVEAEPALH